jgi:hypothetical protein
MSLPAISSLPWISRDVACRLIEAKPKGLRLYDVISSCCGSEGWPMFACWISGGGSAVVGEPVASGVRPGRRRARCSIRFGTWRAAEVLAEIGNSAREVSKKVRTALRLVSLLKVKDAVRRVSLAALPGRLGA